MAGIVSNVLKDFGLCYNLSYKITWLCLPMWNGRHCNLHLLSCSFVKLLLNTISNNKKMMQVPTNTVSNNKKMMQVPTKTLKGVHVL